MKTRLFNRNVIFVLAVFCVIGAVAAAIKVQTAQRTVGPSGQSSDIQVGTATARPGGFQIHIDQAQLQNAMGKVNGNLIEWKQTAERQKGGVKYENISIFRSVVEKEATAKLNALFPRGVPPGTESKIKITIKVKLTDPPEISITIEF
jgi:hypothetical protein